MTTEMIHQGAFACPLVRIGQDGTGRCTAEVVGVPDLRATADTRTEAIEQVRMLLAERLASGQLLTVAVLPLMPLKAPGWEEADPLEQEFLKELARRRREDLELTLREYEEEDRGCSATSSTPTT